MSRPPAPRGGGGGGRGQTSLWKRLSGQTAQAYGHPLRGPPSAGPPGRSGVTFIPVATIVEEPQPPPGAPGAPGGGERAEAGRPRRSRSDAASAASDAPAVWALLATHTLVCCLGVAQFLVSALGLDRSPRAVAFWALLLLRARRLRAAWEAQMEATRGLTLRLSSACLGTLAAASTRVREEEERVAALLRRALSFEHKLNVGEAIRCYEAASKLVPDDPEPLVGLAKCLSDRVFEREVAADVGRARTLATQAVHLSERAIALKPDNPRAHLASAVALARLAMYCPNQKKIEITKTVRERVITCLSLSPDDDVALHVLGRWEYEMVCVGFAVRLLLKVVYGGLKVGSLDAAHRCLARAIELRPDRLVHRVVMARILLKQGRQPEAVDELRTALRSRVEDINAVHERREATDMLRRLGVQLPGVDADTPLGSPRPASPPPAGAQPLTLESPLVMRRCSWSVEALPEAVPFDFAFPPPPGFEPEAADG